MSPPSARSCPGEHSILNITFQAAESLGIGRLSTCLLNIPSLIDVLIINLMPLCALCRSFDFHDLPSIPACYEGRWASIKPGKTSIGSWNWQLKYQEGSRVPNASAFSTRLGLPYRHGLEDWHCRFDTNESRNAASSMTP